MVRTGRCQCDISTVNKVNEVIVINMGHVWDHTLSLCLTKHREGAHDGAN